jgi:hypothetical protein
VPLWHMKQSRLGSEEDLHDGVRCRDSGDGRVRPQRQDVALEVKDPLFKKKSRRSSITACPRQHRRACHRRTRLRRCLGIPRHRGIPRPRCAAATATNGVACLDALAATLTTAVPPAHGADRPRALGTLSVETMNDIACPDTLAGDPDLQLRLGRHCKD